MYIKSRSLTSETSKNIILYLVKQISKRKFYCLLASSVAKENFTASLFPFPSPTLTPPLQITYSFCLEAYKIFLFILRQIVTENA